MLGWAEGTSMTLVKRVGLYKTAQDKIPELAKQASAAAATSSVAKEQQAASTKLRPPGLLVSPDQEHAAVQ